MLKTIIKAPKIFGRQEEDQDWSWCPFKSLQCTVELLCAFLHSKYLKIYFSLHTKYTTDQNVRVPPVLVLHYARNEVLVIYEIELMPRLENLCCDRTWSCTRACVHPPGIPRLDLYLCQDKKKDLNLIESFLRRTVKLSIAYYMCVTSLPCLSKRLKSAERNGKRLRAIWWSIGDCNEMLASA